jgi:hypothetical protein
MGILLLLRRSANMGALDANVGVWIAGWACDIEAEAGRPEVNDLGEFGVGFQQVFAGDAWFQAQHRIQSDSSDVAVSSGRSVTGCALLVMLDGVVDCQPLPED